jgi:hypothetical protein
MRELCSDQGKWVFGLWHGAFSFAQASVEYLCSRGPPRRVVVGAGALSPEKGGALRKQSTQGRRLGVAAVLCGGVFVAPLLLLQHGSAHAPRVATGSGRVTSHDTRHHASFYSVVLPSQNVKYESAAAASSTPQTTSPVTSSTSTTALPTTVDPVVPRQTAAVKAGAPQTTTVAPRVTPVTVPAAAAPTTAGAEEQGQATWYAAAPAGMCASPTLPFGTVLTVTNVVTGASTTCTVDDREQAGYPRVVDMSPSGFAQLAEPSQGVVDVKISW